MNPEPPPIPLQPFSASPQAPFSPSPHPAALWACALGIIISAIIVYHGTFDCPFIFDDEFSIVKNPSIRGTHLFDALISQPGDGNPVQGRPVLNLTFAVNYALGGLDPRGYHFFNLVIHILVALLLFVIIRRTLQSGVISERIRRRAMGIAFATALLWTVHPLATSAVTYMTQRAESLAGMFYLLTLYCVVLSASASRRYAVIAWGCLATIACGLGMATKEVIASAPLIVFLYDGIFLSPDFKSAFRRRWPLYGALSATWIIMAVLVIVTKGRGGTTDFGAGAVSLRYAATQLWAVVHYLQLCFWPRPLVLDYGIMQAGAGEIVPSAIIVAFLFAAVIFAFRKHKPLAFAGVFIFAVLAPSSSIVPITTQTVAEHRMYLPLAAVVLLTVLAVFTAFDAVLSKARFFLPVLPLFLRGSLPLLLSVAAAVVLGRETIHRNGDYESELTIWQDTFNKRPQNVRAATYLGAALINQNHGNPSPESIYRSLAIFNRAIAIDSTYGLAYANRGLAYYRMKRFDEALHDYDRAIAANSRQGNRAEMFNNRGILLGEAGRTAEAIADFNEALHLNPFFASAHNNLGSAYVNLAGAHASAGDSADATEDNKQAIGYYTDALRCDSNLVTAHRGRAAVYGKQGRYQEAADDCSAIIRIDPSDAVAYGDRAICYFQLKRYREAWFDVQTCRNKGGMPNTELVLLLSRATGASR